MSNKKCIGITKQKTRCTKVATAGADYCYLHVNQTTKPVVSSPKPISSTVQKPAVVSSPKPISSTVQKPAVVSSPKPSVQPFNFTDSTCAICYEDIPEEKCGILECNHLFCTDCLRRCISLSCPVCRIPMTFKPGNGRYNKNTDEILLKIRANIVQDKEDSSDDMTHDCIEEMIENEPNLVEANENALNFYQNHPPIQIQPNFTKEDFDQSNELSIKIGGINVTTGRPAPINRRHTSTERIVTTRPTSTDDSLVIAIKNSLQDMQDRGESNGNIDDDIEEAIRISMIETECEDSKAMYKVLEQSFYENEEDDQNMIEEALRNSLETLQEEELAKEMIKEIRELSLYDSPESTRQSFVDSIFQGQKSVILRLK